MAISEEQQLKQMRYEILDNPIDDSCDEVFLLKLADAKNMYLRLVYPFDTSIEELPNDRARAWQTKCAIELYNIIGKGNIVSYSENGLQETMARGGISADLLNELPPAKAGVPV